MSNLNVLTIRNLKIIVAVGCINFAGLMTTSSLYAQKLAVTTVNFKKDKFNRIFLPAKVDKDSLSILFGTYSKTLRLTPYFFETMALYPSGGRLSTIDKKGKHHSKTLFYLPKIQIGNIKFRNEETTINQAFPDSIATGSTGTLLVYQYNWKIDNDKNVVSISKLPFTSSRAYTTINYKNNSYPTAVVHIGSNNSEFILDLGSGGGFVISTTTSLGRDLIENFRLRPSRIVTSNIHSNRLVDTIYEVVIPSLLFNGVKLNNQKVVISSATPHNTIGTGFLGNYNVILNNSKKRKIESSFILEKRLMD